MDNHSCFLFENSESVSQPTTRLRELLVGGAIHTCRTLEDKDSFSHFFVLLDTTWRFTKVLQ